MSIAMGTKRTVTFDEAVALTAAMRTAWLRMVDKRLKEAPRDAADWSFDVPPRLQNCKHKLKHKQRRKK
jgi:hypothetical protein